MSPILSPDFLYPPIICLPVQSALALHSIPMLPRLDHYRIVPHVLFDVLMERGMDAGRRDEAGHRSTAFIVDFPILVGVTPHPIDLTTDRALICVNRHHLPFFIMGMDLGIPFMDRRAISIAMAIA